MKKSKSAQSSIVIAANLPLAFLLEAQNLVSQIGKRNNLPENEILALGIAADLVCETALSCGFKIGLNVSAKGQA